VVCALEGEVEGFCFLEGGSCLLVVCFYLLFFCFDEGSLRFVGEWCCLRLKLFRLIGLHKAEP